MTQLAHQWKRFKVINTAQNHDYAKHESHRRRHFNLITLETVGNKNLGDGVPKETKLELGKTVIVYKANVRFQKVQKSRFRT